MKIFGVEIRLAGSQPAPPEKPKRVRVRLSPSEKEKALRLNHLRWLQEHDFPAYRRIMDAQVGLRDEREDSELENFEKMHQRLKKMGLVKNLNEIDDGPKWMRELMEVLPDALKLLTAQQVPPPTVQQPAAPVAQQPPQLPPAAAPAPAPPPPIDQSAQQEEEPLDAVGQYLKSQLGGKTPEAAAAWLDGMPQAQQLVAQLVARPETEAYRFLMSFAQSQPQFRGAALWLQSQGEHWVCNVARALHQRHGQPAGVGTTGL